MRDIIERLRHPVSNEMQANMTHEVSVLIQERHEAAEEIDKLRAEVKKLEDKVKSYRNLYYASERRIDTFRGELKRADEQIRKMLSFEMFC